MQFRKLLFAALLAGTVSGSPAFAGKTGAPLVAAAASSERSEADRARDADRKPAEVMAFAGVKPGMSVIELAPGGGYFTRLLSLAVGKKGKVYPRGNRISDAVTEWAGTLQSS